MPSLTIHLENLRAHTQSVVTFERFPIRVGRNQLNEIRLDDGVMSQWHGCFTTEAGQLFYTDLGSTNGSWVNGQSLAKNDRHALLASDVLEFGVFRCRVQFVAALDIAEPADSDVATSFNQISYAEVAELARRLAPPVSPDTRTPPHGMPDALPTAPKEHFEQTGKPDKLTQAAAILAVLGPAREAYFALAREHLQALPEEQRQFVIQKHFPELGDPNRESKRVAQLLSELTGTEVAAQPEHLDRQYLRIARTLMTLARSVVELRTAHEHLRRELGLGDSTQSLGEAQASPQALLRFNLDMDADGDERLWKTSRALGELASHHVGMLQGLREGARALLKELDPEKFRANGFSFGANALKQIASRRQDLLDGDHFVKLLFGDDFARTYRKVVSGENQVQPTAPRSSVIVDMGNDPPKR